MTGSQAQFRINLPGTAGPFGLALTILILGFVCGAIPFGFILGRILGTDVRQQGSGNIGFTNVARVLGWKVALPVLVLDALKGLVPVLLVSLVVPTLLIGPTETAMTSSLFGSRLELLKVLAGLGAVLGHIFTPLLRFRGGKGVATAAGVLAALSPVATAICVVVFLVVLILFRYVSLASLASALALPLVVWAVVPQAWPVLGLSVLIFILILIRHVTNIRRLAQGDEPRCRLPWSPKP